MAPVRNLWDYLFGICLYASLAPSSNINLNCLFQLKFAESHCRSFEFSTAENLVKLRARLIAQSPAAGDEIIEIITCENRL